MTEPTQPGQPDVVLQAAVGLADTPAGQKLAVTLTMLLGKDAAKGVAEAIVKLTDAMSSTGLVVAGNGAVPKVTGDAVA